MATAQLARVRYEPTRLFIPARLPYDEWRSLLSSLGAMARNHQWWVGDALVHGEERYGDEFAQGADELGLAPHTLVNYRWVAAAVQPGRRRESLGWSHHAEVARLEPGDQAAMLDLAEANGWGVRDLRRAVAAGFPVKTPRPPADDDDSSLYDQPADPDALRLWQALSDLLRAWERLNASGLVAKDEAALENVREQAERAERELRGPQ